MTRKAKTLTGSARRRSDEKNGWRRRRRNPGRIRPFFRANASWFGAFETVRSNHAAPTHVRARWSSSNSIPRKPRTPKDTDPKKCFIFRERNSTTQRDTHDTRARLIRSALWRDAIRVSMGHGRVCRNHGSCSDWNADYVPTRSQSHAKSHGLNSGGVTALLLHAWTPTSSLSSSSAAQTVSVDTKHSASVSSRLHTFVGVS